jgi:PmbA protein
MSGTQELKKMARTALDGALQRGVKGVRAVAYRSRNVSVTYRKGRPDRVEESSRRSLTLHLYIDGKYTACETNDLRREALDSFLDDSVAMARAMTPDPFREMPDPKLYEGRRDVDLELYDPAISEVGSEERRRLAGEIESAALDEAGERAISAETSYEDEQSELYQIHSNGFEGSRRGTQFWMFGELSLRDESDRRPSGWDISGSRRKEGLPDPAEVGRGAAERARLRLGAEQLGTRRTTMIVENRTVGRLLGKLLAVTSGRAVQQRRSFLADKMGEKVGSELLTLVDDPFVPGGFGSRLFDSEGIAAEKMPVFRNGVFRNFYIDTYYGKKLEAEPTTGSRSNVVIPPGEADLERLVADAGDGILVRGFIGGNSNPTTGDFSLGVYGTLFQDGKLGEAVAEMNIAGNHLELWKRLAAVGSDTWKHGRLRVPSLVFEDVQFSGS